MGMRACVRTWVLAWDRRAELTGQIELFKSEKRLSVRESQRLPSSIPFSIHTASPQTTQQ